MLRVELINMWPFRKNSKIKLIKSEVKADEIAPNKSPDWRNLPDEIWEIILETVFQSCVYEWPHRICSVFNHLYNKCDRSVTLIKVYFQSLPQTYIGISDVLPKETKSRITDSVLRLVRQLGSFSGPVLELKRFLSSKQRNSAWIEIMLEAFSWHVTTNIFWRRKYHCVKTKFNISHFVGRVY